MAKFNNSRSNPANLNTIRWKTFASSNALQKERKSKNSDEKSDEQLQIIDLNSADSILLISINGVGPFYSKQILEYREKLGGFISYTQFSEIWGLEKLDINNFKNQTKIDTTFIKKININS